MTLSARKRTELEAKVASLRSEFGHWELESEEDRPLEKHHTQIRAVTRTLTPFVERVEAQLRRAALSDESLLARTERIEESTLDLHRIWDFFRSKFVLRYVPSFTEYLAAADDFAWACYRPVEELRSVDKRREPPLVFFNGGWSPFTWPRGTAYVAEAVGDGLEPAQFGETLRRLPIHMIGIPWFQIAHLPEASVIGHEVGHDVDAELELGPQATELVETALGRRRTAAKRIPAWKAWLGEVFADVYGTLATGPAYAATLADFLAAPVAVIGAEQPPRDWGGYPTRWLRILVTVETLRHRGLDAQAAAIEKQWTTAFPSHRLPEFQRDVPAVVAALVEGPYRMRGEKPLGLPELVDFGPEEQREAREAADEAVAGLVIPSRNVRCLVAAARLAFDDGSGAYVENDVAPALHERIKEAREIGTRALDPDEQEKEDAARAGRDARWGHDLLEYVDAIRRSDDGRDRDV
jgi:hypothetical protein